MPDAHIPEDAPDPSDVAPDVAEVEAEPASGRSRLRHALFHPGRSQVVVAVLLALVAFAAIVQVRTAETDDTYAGYREQDLVNVLSGLAGASRRARSEITRLEETRDQLVSDTNAQQAALDQATKEADTLSILAGLVPVRGPGVRVTIIEQTGFVQADSILNMVQALRIAGAEAIQINGTVRLAAQSSFTDAVGGLEVDGQLLTSPYVVDVIGSPTALSGALTILEGPRVLLQDDGATVEVTELNSLDIESVRKPVEPVFAQPLDEQ